VRLRDQLRNLLLKLNSVQRTLLSNILGLGAGAAVYTLWQIHFPLILDVQDYGWLQKFVIMMISAILFFAAFLALEEKQ